MKPALYALTALSGVVLLAAAVLIMTTVDGQLSQRSPKEAERYGLATPSGAATAPPGMNTETATRLTILGALVAVLGAGNIMIGSLLLTLVILEKHSMRSRLGTDPKG